MGNVRFSDSYPYQVPSDQPNGIPRPMIRVRLHHRETVTLPFLALVDSGADVSTFHVSLAQDLGIDLSTCRPVAMRGVGGRVEAHACEVEIEMVARRFPAEVRFVPSIVSLLGRHDVFMQFRFAFDQRAQTLLVEPY